MPILVAIALYLFTPIGGIITQVVTSVVSYAGMAIASIWDKDIRADMNRIGWNPFNTNINTVLSSDKVSFYKGVPVYRTNFKRSGSFCAIFLSRKANSDSVRHEWGHTIQQMILGPGKYGLFIGIPSWQNWGNTPYYSRPWEVTADIFGGVSPQSTSDGRYTRTSNNSAKGFAYLATAYFFGPFSYLFLFGEF